MLVELVVAVGVRAVLAILFALAADGLGGIQGSGVAVGDVGGDILVHGLGIPGGLS